MAEAVNVLGSVLMMICKSKVVSEGLVLSHFGKVSLAVDQLVFMVSASQPSGYRSLSMHERGASGCSLACSTKWNGGEQGGVRSGVHRRR